jgi:hypothetical protein
MVRLMPMEDGACATLNIDVWAMGKSKNDRMTVELKW